jgi:Flp pilus assembly protein TadG
MPETAIAVSLILCIFLGIIKLTIVGYQQSQADGAAFVAAHAAAQKTTPSLQSSYGVSKAESVFPHLTSANISVATSAPSPGPNNNGYIVASANLGAGGLFSNQAFGGSVFSLHAHIVEPVVAPPYVPAATIVASGI